MEQFSVKERRERSSKRRSGGRPFTTMEEYCSPFSCIDYKDDEDDKEEVKFLHMN